jgi:DNA-directed RNA polymerase sigma subunit (sigma70/sigma32)
MAIDNTVEVYLREVAAVPLLTPVAETELIVRIQKGDLDAETAKRDLVEAHLRDVVSIAKEYSQESRRLLDLIQHGNLGLLKAANELDYPSDESFATHAARHIRQAIADAPPTN